MNNKKKPLLFADLISLGFSSVIMGIAAFTYCFSRPLISFLLGFVGIIFGIVSLLYSEQEKVERRVAWFGIALSIISIITIIFLMFRPFSYPLN